MKIKQLMNTVKFGVKKHSPEILVVSGIVGLVTGAVLACRATTKVRDILNERNKQLDEVKNTLTDETVSEAAYSIEDSKRDTRTTESVQPRRAKSRGLRTSTSTSTSTSTLWKHAAPAR